MSKITDTQRLDFLQGLTQGYGKGWMLRLSQDGRGWRLHETSRDGAVATVREAIDRMIRAMVRGDENLK